MVANIIAAVITLGIVLYGQALWQARRIRSRRARSPDRDHRVFRL